MNRPDNLRTSPKTNRKPQSHTLALWRDIAEVAAEYDRMSVRQLFYQLVSRGVVQKTESAYKRVADASVQMRLAGELPYRKIADGHRERRRNPAHDGMHDALARTHHFYRRNYWLTQPRNVEVWSEKDALSGVIYPVCDRYGVTYVASRGFPSLTIRYETAIELASLGKPTTILYCGDHDASGRRISDNLEGELREHGADVTVDRIALNPDQIHQWRLPTRSGKRTDSRHKQFAAEFGDASVELDALSPDALTYLVERHIQQFINWDEWQRIEEIEAQERTTLESLVQIDWKPGTVYTINEEAA